MSDNTFVLEWFVSQFEVAEWANKDAYKEHQLMSKQKLKILKPWRTIAQDYFKTYKKVWYLSIRGNSRLLHSSVSTPVDIWIQVFLSRFHRSVKSSM